LRAITIKMVIVIGELSAPVAFYEFGPLPAGLLFSCILLLAIMLRPDTIHQIAMVE
jgi:hypothetical protein